MMEKRTAGDITFLQKQEVEKGIQAGLSREQVRIYTEPGLNFIQMKVIREALCAGLKDEDARLIAKPWINAETMKELIEEMKQGKKITVKKKLDLRKWILPAAAAGAAFLALGVLFFEEPKEAPMLELRQEEIRLAVGMKFEPEQYIRQSSPEGYELILPAPFTAEKPEVRLAMYELKGKETSVKRILRITVADETAPEIHLLQDHAELLRATKFSCRAYLKNAYDAIDGDLTRRVQCSDQLDSEETQTVLYTVKDKAGNVGKTELTIHFADFDLPSVMNAEEEEREPAPMIELPKEKFSEPVWDAAAEPYTVMEENGESEESRESEETEVIEYSHSIREEIPVNYGGTYVEHHFG
ncbi:MAG: hypothetical protein IKD66_08325 [Solobacterium sp.]|nr:hypothetical protein [Solobacterium sp.]